MEKYYKIVTYGCQMNIHESEKLAGLLSERGYVSCEDENLADVIVFNTCCVRENAEQHAYGNIGALKKLKKSKPNLIIAVGGCMTQQKGAGDKLKKTFPFIDIVFGTFNLSSFGDMLDKKLSGKKVGVQVLEKEGKIVEGIKPLRTSFPNAWINISYGCNNFCSYCIVPYVRGRERSRKMEDILNEVKLCIENGYKEITLLGQNVNSYGNDIDDKDVNFAKLLEKIDEIEGDYRIRFMSSHPKDLTEDLVKVIAKCKNVCNYIHLPIQSGSTKVLADMNRKYTREDYLEKVRIIREYMPDATISTDIMVGFPGETEEDFLDTLDICEKVGFSNAFTFVYSIRSGTPASVMENQVSDEVKKDRIMRLVDFQNNKTRELSKTYIGKTVQILCEDYDKKRECYLGRDEYGRMGYFKSNCNLIGKFVDIKITSANGISLYGEIVKN